MLSDSSGVSSHATLAPLGAGFSAMRAMAMVRRVAGGMLLLLCIVVVISLVSWSVSDPSLTHPASGGVRNWVGPLGAIVSDLLVQFLGVASVSAVLPPAFWSVTLLTQGALPNRRRRFASVPVAIFDLRPPRRHCRSQPHGRCITDMVVCSVTLHSRGFRIFTLSSMPNVRGWWLA